MFEFLGFRRRPSEVRHAADSSYTGTTSSEASEAVKEGEVLELGESRDVYSITEGKESAARGETEEGRYLLSTYARMGRGANEDSVGVLPDHNFYVLADGMGGKKGGSKASSIAVRESLKAVTEGSKAQDKVFLEKTAKAINIEVAGDPSLSEMGTTIVAFQVEKKKLRAVHAGDSRIRVYSRDANLVGISRDHNYLQDEITKTAIGLGGDKDEQLKISMCLPETISRFPNPITNVLRRDEKGFKQDTTLVKVTNAKEQLTPKGHVMLNRPELVEEFDLESGSLVIISSDGFDMSEEEIAKAIREYGHDLKLLHLKFLEGSGQADNVSFIIYQQK